MIERTHLLCLQLLLLAPFLWSCSNSVLEELDTGDLLEVNVEAAENLGTGDSLLGQKEKYPTIESSVLFTEVDLVNVDYKDHEGDDAGWVELYNTSRKSVNLKGKALTNSLKEPAKWVFGDVSIPPQSFMLVYLSGKNLKDFVAPHDSVNMIGEGCTMWSDAQYKPSGESYSEPLKGKSGLCFSEKKKRMFGARMRLGENNELGWSSISDIVGTKSGEEDDVVDISSDNELLLHAFISKDCQVSFRLAQTGIDSQEGYEYILTGSGDSSTTYRMRLPAGRTFPDLENIYGTRMSPEEKERRDVLVKVFSYVARNRGHEPHTSFKVKNESGSLFLMNAKSEILDYVIYPKLPVGKSWSLDSSSLKEKKDRFSSWGYANPSPYKFAGGCRPASQSPTLDAFGQLPPSGFLSEKMRILFNSDDYVRCEKNGSVPTENSPLVTAVDVYKTSVLRCASFVPGKLRGEVLSRTYVFDSLPKMPVVFVTADVNSLFDPDTGIYMDGPNMETKEPHYGANYWLDKEIPVFVEFFEPGTNQVAFAKDAGLKIFGNYSRMNAKKSVAITFREKYGDKHLNYPLFPDFPSLTKFKAFLLRDNGGNYGVDYIRDRLGSSISEGMGVDYQRGRSAIVYYNGLYFGIHNIREKSSKYYFETHYGYDPDNIDLLEADNSAKAGVNTDYLSLMDWMKNHDVTDVDNYYAVTEKIDVGNFINYILLELFVNNRDWPANNVKKWRVADPSTKWKWFIYDLDFGFKDYPGESSFGFATAADNKDVWPNGPQHTFLLRRLLENESFKNSFINRMSALLSMNFESSRVLGRIDELMQEVESEISRDQQRWHLRSAIMDEELQSIKNFVKKRPEVILSEMRGFFELGKVVPVNLSSSGPGYIEVNGLRLDKSKIKVKFFAGQPVTLTAVCEGGGVWLGWSDGEKSSTRVIKPKSGLSLTAVFK